MKVTIQTNEAGKGAGRTSQTDKLKTKMKNGRRFLPNKENLKQRRLTTRSGSGAESTRHGISTPPRTAEPKRQEKNVRSKMLSQQ